MGKHTVAPAAYSIDQFCAAHGICRASYYNMKKAGTGPREMRVGSRVLISYESAAEWRREREAEAAQGAAEVPRRAARRLIISDGAALEDAAP
jgi:predicted DNA-binding transcriptional regulator AlpA